MLQIGNCNKKIRMMFLKHQHNTDDLYRFSGRGFLGDVGGQRSSIVVLIPKKHPGGLPIQKKMGTNFTKKLHFISISIYCMTVKCLLANLVYKSVSSPTEHLLSVLVMK